MKQIFYSSKEDIRNRILKNAEDFWNIKDSNDFDPLVKLIVEVLGNELFNISNDVKNLENRIFDKISRILAPDHLISALPAHAIMHAKPLEQHEFISPFTQFAYKKNIKQNDDKVKSNKKADIFFSPLTKVKVNKAEIKFIATGNTVFQTDLNHKQPYFNTLPGYTLEPNTFYIGLTGFNNSKELSNLNLFFDWKNYAVQPAIYNLIALAKVFCEDQLVEVYTDKFIDDNLTENSKAPFYNKHLLNLIKADVLQHYSNKFLTLGKIDHPNNDQQDLFPETFNKVFQPADLNQLGKKVKWLKVVFPASITQEMLNELHVSINAFPVVNKKLLQIKNRLKNINDIVPIRTEASEQMLCVESLHDNKGNIYTEIPYINEEDKSEGSYTVRYGGTERFDTRNAKEVIDYLFELLRDEKAAFSAYGPDFLNTALKNLEQNIALIEQKSSAALKLFKELPSYILLKTINNADIVFLDVWLTQAEDANNIAAGSKIMMNDTLKLKAESVYLLTQTKGGRSRLNASSRVQAYKFGLTTAEKIITKADIINFCKYEFGDKIIGVSITKGLMLNVLPDAGFTKTTDIIIEPAEKLKLTSKDWEELISLALPKLQLRSSMNVHFRMFLKP